jgi:TolB-like protein
MFKFPILRLVNIESRGFVRIVKYIPLLMTLLVLFVPSYSRASDESTVPDRMVRDRTGAKIAVLPLKVNATGDVDYLKRAIVDMLSSRIGSSQAVELVKTNAIRDALDEMGLEDITDDVAEEVGERVGADYVLYGSLSIIGDSLSLDAKLVDVEDGSITPFYSSGRGIDSLVDMAEKMASMVLAPVSGLPAVAGVEPQIPSVPTYMGKFAPKEVERDKEEAVPVKEEKKAVETAVSEEIVVSKKREDFITTPKAKIAGEIKNALWKSGQLKGFFKGFEAIDLDVDGKKELVLISKRDIIIARVEGEGLKVLKEIKGDSHVENIAISSSGGDGIEPPVVYISRLRAGLTSSQILEFKNNDFMITASGIPWLMRAVRVQGNKSQLIGQKFKIADGFYSSVKVLKRDGNRVVDMGPFGLPRVVGLYGFELFDLTGDGQMELVALNTRYRLRVYKRSNDKWEEHWKADGRYGGSLNIIELEELSITPDETEYVIINGRFLYADLDRDGRTELIIKRNEAGGFLGNLVKRVYKFKKGEILSLKWGSETGFYEGFEENWKTRAVSGYIADFALEDMDGDGTTELTILVVEGTSMFRSRPKSYLLSYSLF